MGGGGSASQLLVSSPAVSMMDAVSACKTRKERKVFVVFGKTYREREADVPDRRPKEKFEERELVHKSTLV